MKKVSQSIIMHGFQVKELGGNVTDSSFSMGYSEERRNIRFIYGNIPDVAITYIDQKKMRST